MCSVVPRKCPHGREVYAALPVGSAAGRPTSDHDGPAEWAPCRGPFDVVAGYCHCEYMTGVKGDRLQLRIDPAAKQRLERAAEAAHQSVSAFLVQSAELHAEQVLADRMIITLGVPPRYSRPRRRG